MTHVSTYATVRSLVEPTPAARRAARPLRILFLVSAHNSLSQRTLVALTELEHAVTVEVVDSAAAMEAAVARHAPELIVCPMLKTIIPDSVLRTHRCLVAHPGLPGDRGPSSLDWAIELGMTEWGVTVLEATGEVEGGAVAALRGEPGEILARRHGAVCRATADGAVWITHLKRPGEFKLPAVRALEVAGHRLDVPELPAPLHAPPFAPQTSGTSRPVPQAARGLPFRPRARNQRDRDDGRPRLLLQRHPPERDRGAADPACASRSPPTARSHMGGLFGSEYWTYLLPRRVGEGPAADLTAPPFQPLGARRAAGMGLLDAALGESADRFRAGVRRYAQALARDPFRQLAAKRRKPLAD